MEVDGCDPPMSPGPILPSEWKSERKEGLGSKLALGLAWESPTASVSWPLGIDSAMLKIQNKLIITVTTSTYIYNAHIQI